MSENAKWYVIHTYSCLLYTSVGTLVSALIVGRFVNLYNKRLPLIPHVAGLKEE